MLDSKELVEVEKKFSYLNLMLAVMMVVYFIMFYWFGEMKLAPDTMVLWISVGMIVADFALGKFNYFYSDFFIKAIKFLEMISVAFLAVLSGSFVWNIFVAGFMYLLISVQLMLAYDITEAFSRMDVIFINMVPVSIVLVFSGIFIDMSNFYFFIYLIVIFLIIMGEFCFANGFAQFLAMLYGKITRLNAIASTNREENNTMKEVQSKLVMVNEQLSLQRFKLEKANEEITRRNEETELLNIITKNAAGYFEIDSLADEVCSNIAKYMHCSVANIVIIEKKADVCKLLTYKVYCQEEGHITKEHIRLMQESFFAEEYILKEKMTYIQNDVNVKLECFKGSAIKSAIICSIKLSENYYGLYMIGKCENNWFDEKKNFINNLFGQLSLAFNNVILYSKMRTMAVTDALTEIYNRQYFNSISANLSEQFSDGTRILTAVMFDIDKFKRINDTYGHVCGDEVISYCGHMALKYTANEEEAFAVRYGGEEFVMMFPDKDVKTVLEICSRMHKEIKEKVFVFGNEQVHINISLGIASYPENCDRLSELVNLADIAMYFSKENGRGRITVYIDELGNG